MGSVVVNAYRRRLPQEGPRVPSPSRAPRAAAVERQLARQCGNLNDDEVVDISDAIYLLEHIFLGGDPPRCALAATPEADFARRVAGIWFSLQLGTAAALTASGTYLDIDRDDFSSAIGGYDSPTIRPAGRSTRWRSSTT